MPALLLHMGGSSSKNDSSSGSHSRGGGGGGGGGGAAGASAAALSELQGMGFGADQAAVALEASGGDVVQAAELLLSQQPPAAPPPVQPARSDRSDGIAARERERNEAALRMAMEESMRDEPPPPAPAPAPVLAPPPAAMSEEDMLAEAIRASLELESPSSRQRAPAPAPEPAAPPGGTDVADVLRQHATALEGHPLAVDTLIAVLQMILDNPTNTQYRRLRLSNRKFRATLAVRQRPALHRHPHQLPISSLNTRWLWRRAGRTRWHRGPAGVGF